MQDTRPNQITIKLGDTVDLGDFNKPQEWLVEGFNPDGSVIVTRKGRWKTIGFKQGPNHTESAIEPAIIPRQRPLTRF